MKLNLYIASALVLSACSLQSCLDYDNPGAEFNALQTQESTEKHQGDVDKIDFSKLATKEEVKEALEALKINLGQSKTAQYYLRGGKNGQTPVSHAYQFQYNLSVDAYAQYLVVPHKDFPYSNTTLTSSYNISEKFNGGPHGGYGGAKNALMPLLNHPMIDRVPELKAINLLYYCLAAQERADLSGPFSYLEDKQNSENPTIYNDVPTIYNGIVNNLNTIVACLKNYDTRPDWYKQEIAKALNQYNVTSRAKLQGKPGIESYIALANSLKLRMAMHIVKVNPALAKQWAEEAVASGVVERVEDQQGIFQLISGFTHPLVEIANSWNDTRMSASFESLLMSLDHPTTKYFWKKNSLDIKNPRTGEVLEKDQRIVGIRTGTRVKDGQSPESNEYERYSTFNSDPIAEAPLYFVKYAEVCFLRAEGALRGWNMGGTAEHFYNEGIRNSYFEDPENLSYSEFPQYIDEYLKKEKPTAYVQKDPMGGEDWQSVTKIGVKWNEADDREVKLEKIITQKYIALFPLSTEAWTELRRTGYPKLFPVLNPEDGDGTLDNGDVIRRIPWLPTDPQGQSIVDRSGLHALGGADFQGTRLWWDVPGPNF